MNGDKPGPESRSSIPFAAGSCRVRNRPFVSGSAAGQVLRTGLCMSV
jgi:hypothetical protein